jgi:hypothetical protein
MILKNQNTSRTTYSPLDLLGSDEVALSKAFAFLLSNDKDCYFKFLNFVGVSTKNTENNYFKCSIITEKKRAEGRTDIELKQDGNYHVIVECKINKGKAIKQRTQYLTAFDQNCPKKVLCFLTQERDTSKQVPKEVVVKNLNWLDIIELYNTRHFTHKEIVSDFLKYTTKNYKMRELKEILVQDVSEPTEIERFEDYGVYRRDQTFGAPIYFAPYFNRNCGRPEGISNLSKILGILTFKPTDVDNYRSDLESFSSDKTQINNWIKGVKHGKDKKREVYTYYFLDKPIKFTNALRKDGGIKKGRGKNWIAAMIPPNRCVTFSEFIKHIPELMTNGTNR